VQVPPPAPSPLTAPLTAPPAPAPFMADLERTLLGCVVMPAYSTSQRYVFMGAGRVRSIEDAVAEQEAGAGCGAAGPKDRAEGACADAAARNIEGASLKIAQGVGAAAAGGAEGLGSKRGPGSRDVVQDPGTRGPGTRGPGSRDAEPGLWQVTLDDPVLMPGCGLTLKADGAQQQQQKQQQQQQLENGEATGSGAGPEDTSSLAPAPLHIPHPTYRQHLLWCVFGGAPPGWHPAHHNDGPLRHSDGALRATK